MYKIGDFVVYRLLSVCKIESLEVPSFESDSSKQYYKLAPVFENQSNTTIYVPTSSIDSLRPVTSKKEAEVLLQELPDVKPTVCTVKKPPQVTAYYQELLNSCDLKKYFSLLKEITQKEKTNAKKLSEIDLRFRNKTERLLCEEFAVALALSPEEIKNRMYEKL